MAAEIKVLPAGLKPSGSKKDGFLLPAAEIASGKSTC